MAYLGNSPINRLYSTQAITLTQGQTTVNVNYTPGMVLFFKNGALLDPGADYTATNGSAITLANAASAGDVLRWINLSQFAVANALPLSGGTMSGPLTGSASASQTAAGLIAIATTALAQALTDDTTALTPKKLADAFGGANQSLTANGYQKLPSGLIIQWMQAGVATNSNGDGISGSLIFPVAFPTALLQFAGACKNASFNGGIGLSAITTTGASLGINKATPSTTVTASLLLIGY